MTTSKRMTWSPLRVAWRLANGAALAGLASAAGCEPAAEKEDRLPEVVLSGESEPVPYSENFSVSLVDSTRVCMIRSYETEVVCGDRTWSEITAFGRVGDGPGEFRSPFHVVRGPDGSVGVVDGALSRLTVFDAGGQVVISTRTPFLFQPIAPFGSTVTGRYATAGEVSPGTPVATVRLQSQEVISDRMFPHPSEVGMSTVADRGLAGGAKSPNGEITFLTGVDDFVEYTGEGEVAGTFAAEGFREENPSARDIEEFSSRQFLGSLPGEAEVQRFSEESKRYMHPGTSMKYDDSGRLWVLTLRDRDVVSYFDVYFEREWLGSVEVRDRAYGFDVLGDQLVVLVERAARDDEGLPVRAFDWYRVR
jgi:hypothetical protein